MNRKQIFSFLLSLILLYSASLPAFAADDAGGLAYSVDIAVYDSGGAAKTVFTVGEEVVVKVLLRSTGSGTAPVYALQGRLSYGTGLKYKSHSTLTVGTAQHVQATKEVSFAAVDANGMALTYPCELLIVTFEAEADGRPFLRLSDVIVANSDATKRSVSVGGDRQLTIGSGNRQATAEVLSDDIRLAEDLLNSAVVSDTAISAYYPAFRVTQLVYAQLSQEIAAAKAVLSSSPTPTEDQFKIAIDELQLAVDTFTANKIYSYPPSSSSNVAVAISYGAGGSAGFASGEVSSVVKGASLTIQATPDNGYEVLSIYINGERFPGQNSYTIASTTFATEVYVEFCLKPPFTDIAANSWYYDAVRYTWAKELFNGVSNTSFDPDGTTSRGMVVTLLYRMTGCPAFSTDISFRDVDKGAWYETAVLWAAENEIVSGIGNGLFAPNDSITREQLALMLYRYARYRGDDLSRSAELSGYNDVGAINSWALDALQWAVGMGLISGRTTTTIVPNGTATRAETAVILRRFLTAQYHR